jgi:hypothetical protein
VDDIEAGEAENKSNLFYQKTHLILPKIAVMCHGTASVANVKCEEPEEHREPLAQLPILC